MALVFANMDGGSFYVEFGAIFSEMLFYFSLFSSFAVLYWPDFFGFISCFDIDAIIFPSHYHLQDSWKCLGWVQIWQSSRVNALDKGTYGLQQKFVNWKEWSLSCKSNAKWRSKQTSLCRSMSNVALPGSHSFVIVFIPLVYGLELKGKKMLASTHEFK